MPMRRPKRTLGRERVTALLFFAREPERTPRDSDNPRAIERLPRRHRCVLFAQSPRLARRPQRAEERARASSPVPRVDILRFIASRLPSAGLAAVGGVAHRVRRGQRASGHVWELVEGSRPADARLRELSLDAELGRRPSLPTCVRLRLPCAGHAGARPRLRQHSGWPLRRGLRASPARSARGRLTTCSLTP
jgi:hypothetical protein